MVLFVWGRWRYDVVALFALLIVAVAGVVPAEQAFAGFGHAAVVTVAAVLVVSRGLERAGVVDALARALARAGTSPTAQVATLTLVVAVCSGFMNNVGALALLMPVAIWMSRQAGRSPSLLLMPLAFGSLLGGTMTLIGTPPNIIIAAFRQEATGSAFGMFDFLPVGGGITLAGLVFIALLGWRLTARRDDASSPQHLFEVGGYMAEVRVPPASQYSERTLHDLLAAVEKEADVVVLGHARGEKWTPAPSTFHVWRPGDVLTLEADADSLRALLEVGGLELTANGAVHPEDLAHPPEELQLMEAVVAPSSPLVGRTTSSLDLRERFGVNVLGVARQGHQLRRRLGQLQLEVGDILLLQGGEAGLRPALASLGLLPLEARGVTLTRRRRIATALTIFGAALALVGAGVLSPALALTAAAGAMVLLRLLSLADAYDSIDWGVVVLLGAMIPIGQALDSTGGAASIAHHLLELGRSSSPAVTLSLLMGATMLLTNLINNAAAAVLMGPIAISVAHGSSSSVDPFLMGVAVGASCAFLTPIGQQSNTLVMAPGGYRFGDYWRMGLPLSLLVMALGVPLILWAWPP
jgi:di/tricarboxylate transporter